MDGNAIKYYRMGNDCIVNLRRICSDDGQCQFLLKAIGSVHYINNRNHKDFTAFQREKMLSIVSHLERIWIFQNLESGLEAAEQLYFLLDPKSKAEREKELLDEALTSARHTTKKKVIRL